MSAILVSIILPVHNAVKFIGSAIDSIFLQSYNHWELIIINDGSSDGSEKIIISYDDNRIKFLDQKNQGVSSARNFGLKKMAGDYFCFLDADDVFPTDSLKARLKVFEENSELEFVDGSVDIYNANLTNKVGEWKPSFKGNPLLDLIRIDGKSFFGPSWMIKRKPEKVYRFKEGLTHGEDLLFFIDLAREGGLYGYTEETILQYRTGHQSAMKNLKGLEQGYRNVYREIKKMEDVPEHLKEGFRKKSKSIMVKSYLGNGKIIDGLRVWRNKSW